MPLYFFHLRHQFEEIIDPEGQDLGGIDAARNLALDAARDTLSADMKKGIIDLRFRIDVEDEQGTLLHSIAFKDAFEVLGKDAGFQNC